MFSLLRTNAVSTAARHAFSTSQVRADIARITLVGFLATEPEVAQLANGREIMRYTIGVSRGQGKAPSWFRVANFDPEGRGGKEYLSKMPKGTQVFFEGDVALNTRETEDGKKITDTNIFQRTITALRRPKERTPEEEEENQG